MTAYECYDESWRKSAITIEAHTTSEWNDLWVFNNGQYRFMTFGLPKLSQVQSCQSMHSPHHLVLPYTQMMSSALWFSQKPKRILILGHGAGSLAGALGVMLPGVAMDLVDIDAEVFELSKSFFYFKPEAKTSLHVADALAFVEASNSDHYDMIFLDVYDQTGMPSSFTSVHFTESLMRILNVGGVLVVNTFLSPEVHADRLPYHLFWSEGYRLVEPRHQANSVLFFIKGQCVLRVDDACEDLFKPYEAIGLDSATWFARLELVDLRPLSYETIVY